MERGYRQRNWGSERSRDWLEAVHQFGARWDKGQEHSTLLLWEKNSTDISLCTLATTHYCLDVQMWLMLVTEGWSTHEWMEDGQESHRLPQIEKDVLLVLFCFWDTGNNRVLDIPRVRQSFLLVLIIRWAILHFPMLTCRDEQAESSSVTDTFSGHLGKLSRGRLTRVPKFQHGCQESNSEDHKNSSSSPLALSPTKLL